jgi:preprotein translocase subunit YajC
MNAVVTILVICLFFTIVIEFYGLRYQKRRIKELTEKLEQIQKKYGQIIKT